LSFGVEVDDDERYLWDMGRFWWRGEEIAFNKKVLQIATI
jgi:hypothetical protein